MPVVKNKRERRLLVYHLGAISCLLLIDHRRQFRILSEQISKNRLRSRKLSLLTTIFFHRLSPELEKTENSNYVLRRFLCFETPKMVDISTDNMSAHDSLLFLNVVTKVFRVGRVACEMNPGSSANDQTLPS